MNRLSSALALTVAALWLAAPPVPAPARPLLAASCATLHGQDIAPGAAARIVEVPLNRARTRSHLLGCALPGGPVRTLTPSLAGHQALGGGRFRDAIADLEAVRGTTAVVFYDDERGTGDGAEQHRAWRRLYDLRTGRSYAVWTFAHDEDADHEYDLGDPKRILPDGHGRVALAYVDETARRTTIAAFTTTGRRAILARAARASLPVASLRLRGERIAWTLDGRGHSANLSDLPARPARARAAAAPPVAAHATMLPPTGILDLAGKTGAPVWRGTDPAALTGLAVAPAGDFDGDGRPDVAVGEPGAGVVHVVGAGGAVAILGDGAGTALAPAGDVNGDGRGDLLVGAPAADLAYLVLGRTGRAAIDLATDPGVLRIDGPGDGARFGTSLTAIGDLDGDGVPEIVVGAPRAEVGGRGRAGAVYVVHGRTTGGTVASADAWRIDGPASGGDVGARFGQSVGTVGDLDGDGRPEVVAGAPRAGATTATDQGNGMAYVIWGRPDTTVTDVDALGAAGLTLARTTTKHNAAAPSGWDGDWLGGSVAGVGDVNGDGVPDLAVGAQLADAPSRPNAGAAFVVYGRRTPGRIDVSTLGDATGYRIDGVAADDFTGSVVGPAGDLNADGHPDVLVAAPFAAPSQRPQAGAVYVVFGGDRTAPPLDLSELGARALRIGGAATEDTTGAAAVTAGDLDGDGGDDLLLGAPHLATDFLLTARATGPGSASVVHGATPARAGATPDGPAAVVADPGYAEALQAGCRMATNVEALIEDNDYTDAKADPARIRRDALEAFIDDPRNADTVLGVAGSVPIFEPTVLGPATGPALGRTLHDAVRGEDSFPGYPALIASLGVLNPAAQARILLVDGYLFRSLSRLHGLINGSPPTYVIAVGRPPDRDTDDIHELARLARETRGGLYRAENPREIERAFQRIESRLRCDLGDAETDHDEIYPGAPEVLAEDEVDDDAETADVEVSWRDPDAGFEVAEVDIIDRANQVVRRIDGAAVQKAYRLNTRRARRAAVVGGRGRTFRALHLRRVRAGTRIRVVVRAQRGARGGRVYGRITQSRMRR